MTPCFICGSEHYCTVDYSTGIILCDNHLWELNHNSPGKYLPNTAKYDPPKDISTFLRRLADVFEAFKHNEIHKNDAPLTSYEIASYR
jgi:hypothetical protein